jgi:hypothetical protein
MTDLSLFVKKIDFNSSANTSHVSDFDYDYEYDFDLAKTKNFVFLENRGTGSENKEAENLLFLIGFRAPPGISQ